MENKLIAMILGIALVLVTSAIVTTQAFALSKSHGPVCPPDCNGVHGGDHTNNGNDYGQASGDVKPVEGWKRG